MRTSQRRFSAPEKSIREKLNDVLAGAIFDCRQGRGMFSDTDFFRPTVAAENPSPPGISSRRQAIRADNFSKTPFCVAAFPETQMTFADEFFRTVLAMSPFAGKIFRPVATPFSMET